MALTNVQHYDWGTMDAANEYTPMFQCWDFQFCRVSVYTASSANATIKFYGSGQETAPTLANADSTTNQIALQGFALAATPWTAIAGATGQARAGTDANYHFIVDCSALRRLWALMTARAAWSVTVYFDFFNKN
jgi:hypothetical protein